MNQKKYFKKWFYNKILKREQYKFTLDVVLDYLKNNKYDLEPFYQRDIVWNKNQKINYIENLFTGRANINLILIFNGFESDKSYEVLDGKQRINSIFEFIQNKFSIFDGIKYKDLISSDKFDFGNLLVNITEISSKNNIPIDNNIKIDLFLEVNELGTKITRKHLKKVKEMKK